MEHLKITEEEYEAIRAKMEETDRKCVKRRLETLMLTHQEMDRMQIAEITDVTPSGITQMRRRYRQQGLEEFARNKYDAHNRLLTFEQEEEILSRFNHRTLVRAKEVKAALAEACGKEGNVTNFYNVMRRHGGSKAKSVSQLKLNAADAEAYKGTRKDPARYWIPKPEAEQMTQNDDK